jgi:SAM-dependent methyltransferase
MDENPLAFRTIWNRKPALRAIYNDIYRRMLDVAVPGPTLEVGGGSGNFKAFASNTISTDILPAAWLDLVCDAQRLPFAPSSFSNIVMVDVLHHIEHPLHLFNEARRVLRPGGRLIFCEPAITPLSGLFYRAFHREPVDMSAEPLAAGAISADKDPYDSNQAIPTLLVGRYRDALAKLVPQLRLVELQRFSFLAYPLSGGFQSWSLLPQGIAEPLLAAEWSVRKLIGRVAAFRLLAAYENTA